ncbi:MAG: hypothetical protein HQM02_04540 [Magnetococcales bacterium]|nr:hypothetical protein [Magnetococcales bacterium]
MNTRPLQSLPGLLLGMGVLCAAPVGLAEERCRVGFDVGSSGVRVGSPDSDRTARIKVDYLGDVWSDNRINLSNEDSIAAFRNLPVEIGKSGCLSVAGGYSAWRYAMEKGNPADVAATLATFQERSGVYFFVIPQEVEGSYGHFAAKQLLGEGLRTPFILDIGGGSLQIAGQQDGWGAPLGQKSWRKLFCEQAKQASDPDCAPNPVGKGAMERAAVILAPLVAEARAKLGGGIGVTAVSSMVVKEIFPILRQLASDNREIRAGVHESGFTRQALAAAIRLLAEQDDARILQTLNACRGSDGQPICNDHFVANFVSDMLLLHTLLDGLAIDRIQVGAADITNIPGILADTRPVTWSNHYPCYLNRLQSIGVQAFSSDPTTCQTTP